LTRQPDEGADAEGKNAGIERDKYDLPVEPFFPVLVYSEVMKDLPVKMGDNHHQSQDKEERQDIERQFFPEKDPGNENEVIKIVIDGGENDLVPPEPEKPDPVFISVDKNQGK
jgi:hypothetical protein